MKLYCLLLRIKNVVLLCRTLAIRCVIILHSVLMHNVPMQENSDGTSSIYRSRRDSKKKKKQADTEDFSHKGKWGTLSLYLSH